MESPVIVENLANFTMPVDPDETGFPFEDDYSFQDRLNNIAQRHPEFADSLRLDDFPSLRRKRNGSGSSDHHQDNLRFGGGPSSRFGTFGNRFPFSHHFEDEFANEPAQNRQEKPPEVPKSQEKRGRKPNPNLPQHLSNTVDLGQKQPPVDEGRSQRSMSAPPENRSTQSSSRVENEVPEEQQDMGKSQSRPSEPAAAPNQARERIIPIQVEGRRDPVYPRDTHTHHANSEPQPEQVFGQEKFYQPSYHQGAAGDPFAKRQQAYEQYRPTGFTKQSTPPHHQQQQQPQYQQSHHQEAPPPHPQQFRCNKKATPPPENRPNQQQHEQQQQQQQQQQRATPPPSNDPFDKIKIVKNDVLDLMTKVENFQGTRKDREYIYLDEMLTRNLIKLDDISTDGKDNIRTARKEAIKCIQTCISNLEARAQAREKELKAAGEQQQQQQQQGGETTESAVPPQVETQNQNSQEQQTVCPPIYKTEATINLSGGGGPSVDEQQPSGQEQMEVEQQQQKQETEKKSSDAQNEAAGAGAGAPMETETIEQQQQHHQSESVQSNSSQPETTSK